MAIKNYLRDLASKAYQNEKQKAQKAVDYGRSAFSAVQKKQQNFLSPVPNKVRLRDFAREVKPATNKLIKGTAKFAYEIPKATARGALSIGLSTPFGKGFQENNKRQFNPKEFGIDRIIGNEPVESLGTKKKRYNDWLVSNGYDQKTANKLGLAGVVAGTALDVSIGSGGAAKGAKNTGKLVTSKADDIVKSLAKNKKTTQAIEKARGQLSINVLKDKVYSGLQKRALEIEKAVPRTPDEMVKIQKARQYYDGLLESVQKGREPVADLQKTYQDLILSGHIDEIKNVSTKYKPLQEVLYGKVPKNLPIQVDDLVNEAKKYKSAGEFVNSNDFVFQGVGKDKQSDFLTTKIGEANAYATQRGLNGSGEIRVYKYSDLPDYIKTITSDDSSYSQVIETFGKNFVDRPLNKSEFERIQTAIGFNKDEIAKLNKVGTITPKLGGIDVESQLTDIWNKSQGKENFAGAIAGFETDENGNIQYDPMKGLLGFGGVTAARSKAGQKLTGKFIDTIKKSPQVMADLPMSRVQGVVRNTDELAMKARNLVLDNIDAAENMARNGVDDKAVATSAEIIKHYTNLAAKAATQAEKNAFLDKAISIADISAKNLTEAGRAVQAATIMGRLTPEGALRFAQKTINKYNAKNTSKIPNLTAQQGAELQKIAEKIQELPDGEAKARLVHEFNKNIAELIPSTIGEKVATIWKAGLLTGIKTTGVNVASNLSNSMANIIKDIPATAVDSVASLFTNKRTRTFTTKGYGKGVKEGFQKGFDYLKTGFDERNIAKKFDYKQINWGKSKVGKALGAYEQTIFRLLGAEDQPFYYGAKARSLYDQAGAEAINQGLRGNAKAQFIEKFVQNPPDQAIKNAVRDAETAVFQNKTVLGQIASSGANKARQLGAGGAADFVMPFRQTPTSVAMEFLNYSPVGIAKTIIQNIGKGKFDQRLFSEGMGKGLTGTGIYAIGGALAAKGLITTSAPKTDRERNLWELQGKKPNSIKIGDTWRSVNVFGPAAYTLIAGAYFQEALKKTGSKTQALVTSIASMPKVVVDQTFLKGISGMLNAINDPLRYGNIFFEQSLGSVVPTLVADVATAMTPNQKEINGPIDAMKNRLPFLKDSLPNKINAFGQVVDRGNNWVESMIDPTRPMNSTNESHPMVLELQRLQDANVSATPTSPDGTIQIDGETFEIDPATLEKYQKYVGSRNFEEFAKLIQNPLYQSLSDQEKGDELNSLVTSIRKEANNFLMQAGLIPQSMEEKAKSFLRADDLDGYSEFVKQNPDLNTIGDFKRLYNETKKDNLPAEYTIIQKEIQRLKDQKNNYPFVR